MRRAGVILLFLLCGCTFREDKLGALDNLRREGLRPWFTNLYSNLIQPKCLRCHNGPGSPGRVDLSSYEAILNVIVKGEPLSSPLYLSLNGVGGRMPLESAPLSQREIQIIADWIRAQAPFDGDDPPPQPTPEPKDNYKWLHDNVIVPKCIDCHRGPGGDAGVDLSEYEKFANDPMLVKKGDPDNSLLYEVVKTDFMPLQNFRTKLTPEEKAALYNWILKGAPKEEAPQLNH